MLTNVNANATSLTPEYLAKAAALADVFRPYGIRVYLTARFSAPIEIGGLKTADPLDPEVAAWWKRKADEIYGLIPDFGGFLVKANSEGQPGPQDYGRTHADGANVLADAVAPHGGVVMWRAFVYSNEVPERPGEAGVRRVQAARRDVPAERPRAGQERPDRLPAARALPSPVRRDAEDAADDGAPDHAGVPGLRDAPRLPRPALRGGPPRRHVRARAQGSTVAKVVDGTLHGHALSGHRGRRERRDGPQLVRLRVRLRQLVRLRAPGLGPRARRPRGSPTSGCG